MKRVDEGVTRGRTVASAGTTRRLISRKGQAFSG